MTSPEWEAANEDDSDRFPQTSDVSTTFTFKHSCGATVRVIDAKEQPHECCPARVARYAEAILAEVRSEPSMPGYERLARAVMAVADEERAPLVAEVERLRAQEQRVRALGDALADDGSMRYGGNVAWHIEEAIANEKGDFPDAADRRIASQRERAEIAEAKMAKVEALAEAWESGAPGLEWNIPIGMTFASHLRAALADAPAEQRAEGGA